MTTEPPYKRWYDHEPHLLYVLEVLKSFKDEMRAQSQVFLDKIAEEVGADTVDAFYRKIREEQGDKFGKRWYDADPVVSVAVELLRVVPPDVQKKAADKFIQSLRDQGVALPDNLK